MAAPDASFDPRAYWEDRHRRTQGLDGVGYLGLNGLNPWMYRVRAHVFDRLLAPHRPAIRGARVLDLGAGTGFFVDRWRRLGAREVVAVDLSEVACQRLAASHPGLAVHCLDVTSAAPEALLALGQFDFVSAIDVLFHVVDDAAYGRALARIRSLLRAPDGRLVFTENFLQRRPRQESAWQVSRTLAEIERHLAAAGLVLERRVPLFALLNAPVDADARLLRGAWSLFTRLARRSEALAGLIGAALFPLELALVTVLPDSPSTEIAIARCT